MPTEQETHGSVRSIPTWLVRMHGIPGLRRKIRSWVRNRDTQILSGVGAGLQFNPGHSDPAYVFGTNEPPVQQALTTYLRPGGVFYDIGANVGFFSVLAARLVGPAGRVIAFEPVPENAACLKHNIHLNGFQHITLFEAAVSRSSGEGELLLAHYSGGSALASADCPPDLKGSLQVELVSIDELVALQRIPPPDLVKIDVEGAELEVLEGMRRTLCDTRPVVIFEIDDQEQSNFLHKQHACEDFLRDCGFNIRVLEDSYTGSSWLVKNFVATSQA